MNDKNLRKDLKELLLGGSAHIGIARAFENINPEIRDFKPQPNIHSIFEELDHMRICQEDIFKFTLHKGWKSPEWPDEYWPESPEQLDDEKWDETLSLFLKGLDSIIDLVNNKSIDLTSEIPHGEGRTYLREILLVADHNAYHTGKIVDIRKILGDW